MTVLGLLYFAIVAAGGEPGDNAVAQSVDPTSVSATVAARRLSTATEFRLALEMVDMARQRVASLRASGRPEPAALIAAALQVAKRMEDALQLGCELDPAFRRPDDFNSGKARLELLDAVQKFQSLTAVQDDEQGLPQTFPLRRLQRHLDAVKAGLTLTRCQLQFAETQGVDLEKRRSLLQESKQLELRCGLLAERPERALANRELDQIPRLATDSKQLASQTESLVQLAWELVGGADQWQPSRAGAQVDEILVKHGGLLERLRARVDSTPMGERGADELRSLLIRKAALLREATSNWAIAEMCTEWGGVDAEMVDLLDDSAQVELELCASSEERLRVCSHYVYAATELAKTAEAECRAGLTPVPCLTACRLHLLDTKILFLREQQRNKTANSTPECSSRD